MSTGARDGAEPSSDGGGVVTPISLLPRTGERRPLTPTQLDIWTSQRLRPEVPLGNMGKRHRIRGPLDPERLVRSFDAVVRASDALRTVIVDGRRGRPEAQVRGAPPAATEVVDLDADDLDAWCRRRIAVPVDATRAAYDSVLLRHGDHDWTWWLDLHHVVTDAWSSATVFARTAEIYAAPGDATGEPVPPDLPSFYDHVDHQAQRTSPAERLARASGWEREREAAGPTEPITPYGPRDPETTEVERLPMTLPDGTDLRAALAGPYRTLSAELGLLGLLVTATAVTLHRLDGRDEIVVGVPIHHRSGRAAQAVIGPLMEVYPLRVTLEPGDSFAAVFERVRRSIVAVLRRARPGERPEADFEVVVNVLNARYADFAGLPTETEWMRSGHVEPAHPVRVQAYDYGDDLRLELDLNTALSADGTHRSLPDHLVGVLARAVADPARPIGAGSLATEAESATLARLNPPPASGPVSRDRPVHEQIRDRLRAEPAVVVAEQGGVELTAGELDRRADDLAAWLGGRGIGAGDRVGVRMGRSLDVVVTLQGVLRSGAAFVMLDPDDPPARHETIRRDAELALILDDLPSGSGEDLRSSGDDPGAGAFDPATVAVDDIAYVLYTSGSTGAPKGVPIPHRGLADYLAFAAATYVEPGTRPVVPLHSALVFDLSITSLFLPLLVGGRIVVVAEGGLAGLSAVAARHDLTMLKATPAQLDLLARMIDEPLAVRTVIVGGEAFRRPTAAAFLGRCSPGARIFNEYGPTEAVVGCMVHEWDPARDTGADVPIGVAAPGSEVYVLDAYGERVPPGAWGELWVRRPGMATGYLHRPELGAERFTTAAGVDDRPLYRTGDRARVDRDGRVIYGGRLDDQMKVGGVRLEPGEVEAALVDHPLVDGAIVRTWQPAARRTGLVRCDRCGLGSDVPGVEVDDQGVCSVCRRYDEVAPQADAWFLTPADLDAQRDRARRRRRGEHDCLHLLSGGKDSTYALYQLVERGWRVHALTLDNGYLAEGAKENVRRTVADLGITHEFVTTEAMAAIFRDSLDRYANVCNGCYKTIYTLAVARARELGIPTVVTGLSRGQFFETRLIPHQFEAGRFDPRAIDATVLEARRAYHRTTDAVTELLPEQSVFDDDTVFEEIEFVDFYRYVDVDLTDLYEYLERRAPWVRPADTGRSTNCLINVAGIYVHRVERGYHNYAEPYSWDVRLGHKTRAEALDELDDDIDEADVHRMLAEIGYDPKPGEVLTAWYRSTGGEPVDVDELRRHLRERLPEHAVPSAFVHVPDLPLAASAKVDVRALPAPTRFDRRGDHYAAPTGPTETVLCDVFATVLGLERVGADDDFFDLGGASLAALEAVAVIEARLGVELPDAAVFLHRSPRELAPVVDGAHGGAPAGAARPTVEEIEPDLPPPLSPGEAAMLYEYRLDPADTRYNVHRLYRLRGALDPDRLESVLGELVATHGPLHTSYGADRRRLRVGEALAFEVLGDLTDEAVRSFAEAQRRVPFDLDAGPLVRVHVARTGSTAGDEDWTVLVGLHHISIDAGTFDTLWDQLGTRYAGGPLPEPAFSYAAHGRHRSAQSEEPARSFWLEQRRSVGERGADVAGLSLAAPDPPEPDGYVHRRIDVAPTTLAGGPGTTPFVNALAAAAVVLARYRATDHVELGVTASTKDLADAEPLVGYYLNTLPVALDVDPADSLRDVARRAGDLVTAALPHRTYPFASIVRDARAAGLPVPDVSCMLAYEELAPVTFPGAEADHEILAAGTSVTDATFFVQERGDHLELGLEYRGSVIRRSDADRLLDSFERTIVALVGEPGTPVSVEQARDAAPDLVGPELPGPLRPVVARVLEHAAADPTAPAVEDATGQILTYAELVRRARGLATSLRPLLGVAGATDPGGAATPRVGVAVERRAELLVAIVAAHLAGAAYVPVDPAAPDARVATILDIADPAVVLVSAATEHVADGRRALRVDRAVAGWGPDAAAAVPVEVGLDDPAYVIFTSGSTGVPRGIEVTHRNLAASTAARDVFYDGAPERFLVTSSIGFDSSVVGLFWPLAVGGTVVIPSDEVVRDVERLARLVDERAVTHLLMVPSLYEAMLRRGAEHLAGARVAIVAGEACPDGLVTDHVERLPAVQLVNEYGPSEATVWAAAHRCVPGASPVPIGRAVAGAVLRVADPHGASVPAGVAGELLIAGAGVTAGYLRDAPATAARFVELDGRRWYRTGDRVRIDDAGDLVFLGRLDEQLNVGGVRIEPDEIERELRRRPGVRDAVVVGAPDRPVLVAHLETGDGDPVDVDAVRRHLVERFPASHVPARIAQHERLPRTSHGKLDRAAARELPTEPTGAADPAPASGGGPGAETVARVWRDVLGTTSIGPDTDYFEAGGDSLAAIEIVTDLGEQLGTEVPIAALLAGRTPAGMARLLELDVDGAGRGPRPGAARTCERVLVRPGSPTGPLVLMTVAWDDVFGYQDLAGALPADARVEALVHLPESPVHVIGTVDEMADRFSDLLRDDLLAPDAADRPSVTLLGWSIGGVVAHALADRLAASGVEVRQVAMVDTFFPGEERRLWSNRWWKYRSLLRTGTPRSLLEELRLTVRRRAERAAERVGGSLVRWGGGEVVAAPALTRVGGVPWTAFDHRPRPIAAPVVLYCAATTNPARTERPWRGVAPDLDAVVVPGRHRGHDSIMETGRVERIADDLGRRLGRRGGPSH